MGMPGKRIEASSGLREAWAELSQERPSLRQRDAAEVLGVSEGALVASRCGDNVTQLRPEWPALLEALSVLGRVKTITRNAYAVHETVGVYENVSFVGSIALVQSKGLDLRLMLDHWATGFLVGDRVKTGLRHSLQFYDAAGESVHKIYPEDEVAMPTFASLLSRFSCNDYESVPAGALRASRNAKPPGRDEAAAGPDRAAGALIKRAEDLPAGAREAMVDEWSRLEDTHDFGAMLARHRVDRALAMSLAEGTHTVALGRERLGDVLSRLAETGMSVMTFVGNPGAVQIHSGPIGTVKRIGTWMNILDPEFNLHVREEQLGALWAVTKPTRDGIVTSIEAYAKDGTEVAIFYGYRKPGIVEDPVWRDAVAGIRRDMVLA